MAEDTRNRPMTTTIIGARQLGNILVARYGIFDSMYIPMVEKLRERHRSRFVFLHPAGGDLESSVVGRCTANDKVVEWQDYFNLPLTVRIDDADKEFAEGRAFENKYGILYCRDIFQQERTAAVGMISGAIEVKSNSDLLHLTAATNRSFRFFEALFSSESIDVALIWPRTGFEAVGAIVAEKLDVPVTYPYTGKHLFSAYWAPDMFCSGAMHKVAYSKQIGISGTGDTDATAYVAPGRPKQYAHSKFDVRYSLAGTAKAIAIILFHRMEFVFIDIASGKFGKSLRRPLWPMLRRVGSDFLYFRKFRTYCEVKWEELTKYPYVFFAFQNEPEFSIQGRCKDFNDQCAIIRQLALSLPSGIRVVIKEHTFLGARNLEAYRALVQLPNVVMAHPGIPAVDLIQRSLGVASMNGTVTLEAALFGRRALVFSDNSEFISLSSVRCTTDLYQLHIDASWLVANLDDACRGRIVTDGKRFQKAIESISSQVETFYTQSKKKPNDLEIDRLVDLLESRLGLRYDHVPAQG
jgi:hypothetical protein